MKLYYHPVSTTCRPIMMLAADANIDLEYQVVDLFTGEHMQAPYAAINPNKLIPVLDDGDFRLTESSAILKYLAEKAGSPAYPADLKQRARINERMDWFNTGCYRDLGYGLIYPQLLPHMKRADDAVHQATLEWGRDRACGWLQTLDKTIIGSSSYLCGNEVTIADYFGVAILTVGEVIHIDYSSYPNIMRFIANMKARPNWEKVNAPFYQYFVTPYKEAKFATLERATA
ncbi:MAG: glutathione S-transferase family protein [Casimicrobiaceae bacterium]